MAPNDPNKAVTPAKPGDPKKPDGHRKEGHHKGDDKKDGHKEKEKKKPYEEIGAIFNGNEIKIRVPKSTSKPPKLTPSQMKLQSLCTCDDDDSLCSETCGMGGRGGTGGPTKQLNFQIPDDICESLTNRTNLNSELVYTKKEEHAKNCALCNVTPPDAPKGVHAQKILHQDKDVFILKIGKQTDEPNRTGNIEVELVTPRAPAKLKPIPHFCRQIQCEEEDLPSSPHHVAVISKRKKIRRPRPKCCY